MNFGRRLFRHAPIVANPLREKCDAPHESRRPSDTAVIAARRRLRGVPAAFLSAENLPRAPFRLD
jgi:hypothetical protein